ncbi:DUF3592 domain-containing protein [Nocardia sp. NPDC055321]
MGVVLFGIGQLVIGFGLLRQTIERALLWSRGHRARGVITSVAAERDSEDHRVYRPTVEFAGPAGELRRGAVAGTMAARPRIGARIVVVYRPNDPEHVDALGIARGIGSLIAFPILVVVGVAATILPIAYLLGFDAVLSWSERTFIDMLDRLESALDGPLGWLRDIPAHFGRNGRS